MTFPAFRLSAISVTFVLCSVFAGNCSAEIDLPCVMIHKTKVVEKDDHTCFSINPLPACPESCHASESVLKRVNFHCTHSGKPSPDRIVNMVMTILLPVSCEATLPVFTVPDTTP